MSTVALQYISPQHNTFAAPAQTSCLRNLVKKIQAFIFTRWALVLAIGLVIAVAVGPVAGAIAMGIGAIAAYLLPTMVQTKKLIIFTANMLGLFYDPFEFDGHYSAFIDKVKKMVEARIMGQATFNPTQEQIAADLRYGPILKELVPDKLRAALINMCKRRGLNPAKFSKLLDLLFKYHANDRLFYFLKHCPPSLLGLDKVLRDAAKAANRPFDLPFLNSSATINGDTCFAQKKHVLDALFIPEHLELLAKADKIKDTVQDDVDKGVFDQDYYAGRAVPSDDDELAGPERIVALKMNRKLLRELGSLEGRLLLCYLHQIMNVHLVSDIMDDVNRAKVEFREDMGDPQKRAKWFAERFAAQNADVVFAQECDRYFPQEMAKLGYFSTEKKLIVDPEDPTNMKWVLNSPDGSVTFLKAATFKGAHVHPYDEQSDPKHKNTIVTADFHDIEKPLVLGNCHVSDANNKVIFSSIERVTKGVYQKDKHAGVAMGLDANPQDPEDEAMIREYLQEENLETVDVGPTENKMRRVSILQNKINRLFQRAKNMLVATANSCELQNATVGFAKPPLDLSARTPHRGMPSDQVPVGATMVFKV